MLSATCVTSLMLCEMRMTPRPIVGESADEIEDLLGLRDAQRSRRLVEDHQLGSPQRRRARWRPGLLALAAERLDTCWLTDLRVRRTDPFEGFPVCALFHRISSRNMPVWSLAPREQCARRRGCRRARGPGIRPDAACVHVLAVGDVRDLAVEVVTRPSRTGRCRRDP